VKSIDKRVVQLLKSSMFSHNSGFCFFTVIYLGIVLNPTGVNLTHCIRILCRIRTCTLLI